MIILGGKAGGTVRILRPRERDDKNMAPAQIAMPFGKEK